MSSPELRIEYTQTIVEGFHGTDAAVAKRVVSENRFIRSHGKHQFLGEGVYFFEGSVGHAVFWAKVRRRCEKVGVLGAAIRLGRCLELTKREHIELVEETRDWFRNQGFTDLTDAVLVNMIDKKCHLDTVRAPTHTGPPRRLMTGAYIYTTWCMVICVKNAASITRLWLAHESG